VLSLFSDPSPEPPKIILRDYQQACVEAVLEGRRRGVRRGLIVLPTGCGKTTVFAEVIRLLSAEPEFQALVLAHRAELLEQGATRIAAQNPHLRVGIEAGDQRAEKGANVVVAGVQTIGRPGSTRLPWLDPSLIITDEGHHASADTYCHIYRRYGLFESVGRVFHLGVTATPHRMDNKPLHGTEKAIFEEVLFSYRLSEAIKSNYLCDLRGYRVSSEADLSKVGNVAGDFNLGQLEKAMNTERENELAFNSWAEVASDRQTIVFCSGVDHAEAVAEVFRSKGVKAASVSGAMKREVRDEVIRKFRDGEVQVLTNMDIATEGFDVPNIRCVLLLRPTQSWGLYTQMVGRGTRLSPGKTDCIVIDVVGNSERHALGKQPATLAGLVELPPKMDLEGKGLAEALSLWKDLPDDQQAVLFKRCTSFAGLSVRLTAVDLLAELATPEEVVVASSLSWLKLSETRFQVSCGSVDAEMHRQASITQDPLGAYMLKLQTSKREMLFPLDSELDAAFRQADKIIEREFPGARAVAGTGQPWRKNPPSEAQIKLLRHLKVSQETIRQLTRGDASMLITKLRAGGGR